MACPYFLLSRHYFKIYFTNIIPLSCIFISFLPSLAFAVDGNIVGKEHSAISVEV